MKVINMNVISLMALRKCLEKFTQLKPPIFATTNLSGDIIRSLIKIINLKTLSTNNNYYSDNFSIHEFKSHVKRGSLNPGRQLFLLFMVNKTNSQFHAG